VPGRYRGSTRRTGMPAVAQPPRSFWEDLGYNLGSELTENEEHQNARENEEHQNAWGRFIATGMKNTRSPTKTGVLGSIAVNPYTTIIYNQGSQKGILVFFFSGLFPVAKFKAVTRSPTVREF
jgi:hypothetical protein